MTKSSSVHCAYVLYFSIIAALSLSGYIKGWFWIIGLIFVAPGFVGFVSHILMAITGGSDEDDAGADQED